MTAHRRAIALMLGATFLFSLAGVVTRQLSAELQTNGRFEVAFWRSLFAAFAVAIYLMAVGRGLRAVMTVGRAGLISGVMWAVMFTAFMIALTYTTTANTLLVMSVSPLLTALLARAFLGSPIAGRTWLAIAAAMIGIAIMFAHGASISGAHLVGMTIAFAVPLASAINLVTLQRWHAQVDLLPAVLLGGALSVIVMLPFAFPMRASVVDIGLLAFLGVFQLSLPCALMLIASRQLAAQEIALIGLLELVQGPLWAWLGAAETPARATLYGGALVVAALLFNEVALKRRAARAT